MDLIRVHAPTSVVLLCGGPLDVKSPTPTSLREAFTRVAQKSSFPKHTSLLPEQLDAFFPRGGYRDILTFEFDIAQISDLIILFTESFGSAAELGAFAISPEIAPRLLVFIDDYYYGHDLFIKLGPIRSLENDYGDAAICVLDRHDINISRIENIAGLNISIFAERIIAAFSARIKQTRSRTTFNRTSPGHIIKFTVGLIQHYGALTLDEIDVFLYSLEIRIPLNRLSDMLLCAEFAGWILKEKFGINNYYIAKSENQALQYKLREECQHIDKLRWKTDIRDYWMHNDPERFNAITKNILRR